MTRHRGRGTLITSTDQGSAPVPTSELARLGREIIADGRLQRLRESLGLSRAAMAEMLYVSNFTYAQWERKGEEVKPWVATAERVARFYETACDELSLLADAGIDISGMLPFHIAATMLGLPQEMLLDHYRRGLVKAIDAGILGLWVQLEDITP